MHEPRTPDSSLKTRVWKRLLHTAITEAPRTPAQDAILRLAFTMWSADPRADLTAAQRAWLCQRLAPPPDGVWIPLSVQERARVRPALLAYVRQYRPSIAAVVAAQFGPEEEPL
jgi:hypothetical protein